jgi:murein L,D-transpeptidase YcbB/YkuD
MPLSRRVEQLQLTLERWRWLPSAVTPAVVVNIPEFELGVYDENRRRALRMHVIVGKAYRHRTPVFEDKLESVIVRPWWNVPLSIQREEMVPELRGHPDYLQKNKLQVVDKRNQPLPAAVTQNLLQQLASGEVRLRQEPGPDNSLGLLKFDFPNNYSVYMHGTPARQLFSRSRRDFSHGCIRVEDPESLATWVLRHDPAWDRKSIMVAINTDRTIRIPVSPPVSVLVLYGTAVVEEDGEVHFFSDVYGYDGELKQALALSHP